MPRCTPCARAAAGDPRDELLVDRLAAGRLDRVGGGEREVPRPHEQRVDPRHRRDLLDDLDGVDGLDHRDAEDVGVGRVRRVARLAQRGAHRAPAAVAEGRVAARVGGGGGLGRGVDQRHDDPVGARVEGGHDGGPVVGGHAHQGRHAVGVERVQHRHHGGAVDQAVLGVEADPVEARARHDLGRERIGDRAPASRRRAARLQHRPQRGAGAGVAVRRPSLVHVVFASVS